MTILGLLTTKIIPSQVATLVYQWLVPLFILYNVVGWAGLPAREAKHKRPHLEDEDISTLSRSIRAGWFLGLLVGLAALTAISKICIPFFCRGSLPVCGLVCAGILGGVLGVLRGLIGKTDVFRSKSPLWRRRLLAGLVVCAVAVSITCGALYYDSATPIHDLIAAFYAAMFVGYAATYVFEVGK